MCWGSRGHKELDMIEPLNRTGCIMQNARPDESQARIKTADINNVRYADDTTSMAESEEEQKNFLVRVKGKGEKAKTQH